MKIKPIRTGEVYFINIDLYQIDLIESILLLFVILTTDSFAEFHFKKHKFLKNSTKTKFILWYLH